MTRGARTIAVAGLLLALAVVGVIERGGIVASEGMRIEIDSPPHKPAPLFIAPALGLDRYMDCPMQKGRAARRLQVAHKRDREGITIYCYYDGGVYL